METLAIGVCAEYGLVGQAADGLLLLKLNGSQYGSPW